MIEARQTDRQTERERERERERDFLNSLKLTFKLFSRADGGGGIMAIKECI